MCDYEKDGLCTICHPKECPHTKQHTSCMLEFIVNYGKELREKGIDTQYLPAKYRIQTPQ